MNAPKLKNYASDSPMEHITAVIMKCLATHRAKQIMQEFEDNGNIKSISFSMEINERMLSFRLPARVENVAYIMYKKSCKFK